MHFSKMLMRKTTMLMRMAVGIAVVMMGGSGATPPDVSERSVRAEQPAMGVGR